MMPPIGLHYLLVVPWLVSVLGHITDTKNSRNQKNNPMSENQINQLISRIDLLHQTIKEELQLMGKRFDEIGKEEINRVKGRRNNVLSALGVALTILLGLHSVKPLDDMLFGIILSK